MDWISRVWTRPSHTRSYAAVVGAVLVLGLAAGGAAVWFGRPQAVEAETRLLWGGRVLGERELARVESAFAKRGLTDWKTVGKQVLVPRHEQDKYLAALADADAFPAGFDSGLQELTENASIFESRHARDLRVRHAVQRDLSHVVSSMHGITEATVKYDETVSAGFPRKREARALVAVRADRQRVLSPQQVRSIQETVSAAIAGLPVQNVTVTDLNACRAWGGQQASYEAPVDQAAPAVQPVGRLAGAEPHADVPTHVDRARAMPSPGDSPIHPLPTTPDVAEPPAASTPPPDPAAPQRVLSNQPVWLAANQGPENGAAQMREPRPLAVGVGQRAAPKSVSSGPPPSPVRSGSAPAAVQERTPLTPALSPPALSPPAASPPAGSEAAGSEAAASEAAGSEAVGLETSASQSRMSHRAGRAGELPAADSLPAFSTVEVSQERGAVRDESQAAQRRAGAVRLRGLQSPMLWGAGLGLAGSVLLMRRLLTARRAARPGSVGESTATLPLTASRDLLTARDGRSGSDLPPCRQTRGGANAANAASAASAENERAAAEGPGASLLRHGAEARGGAPPSASTIHDELRASSAAGDLKELADKVARDPAATARVLRDWLASA